MRKRSRYVEGMNKLSRTVRTQVLRCLVDGSSVRATSRITGVSIPTVLKLLVDAGRVAADFQDGVIKDVKAERIQCDEIWSFVGAKQKNVDRGAHGHGDVWTWTAMDSDSKLVLSYLVGNRDGDTAKTFMKDVADRLASRVQITTDGHQPYVAAIEGAFGADIDYAMLIKEYKNDSNPSDPARRYSPGHCTGTHTEVMQGAPDEAHISTSHVERQNLTMRTHMRRFTRLTIAFSKKIENHIASISLHFFVYNFCRVHKTLRVTPAMAAGIVAEVMDVDDLVRMIEADEDTAQDIAARRKDRKPAQDAPTDQS